MHVPNTVDGLSDRLHLVSDLPEEPLVGGVRARPAPRTEDELRVRVPVDASVDGRVLAEVPGNLAQSTRDGG